MQYMDAHSVFVYNIYYWPSLLFLFLPLGWRFPGKETGAMLACRQKFTGYSSIYIYIRNLIQKKFKINTYWHQWTVSNSKYITRSFSSSDK